LKNAKTDAERKKIIKKNERLWKDLKDFLLKLFHNKCWYSEAREIISRYDVDHFRPKNIARQLDGTERPGYWWLAFDWKNYRLAGNIANQKSTGKRGKGDYFPLLEGTKAASGPDSDLSDETIYLLDPVNPLDWTFLTFDQYGKPIPNANIGTFDYHRAEVTIKLLHLDYQLLKDERVRIWQLCTRIMNHIDYLVKKYEKNSTGEIKTQIDNLVDILKEYIIEDAELSSTARTCLKSRNQDFFNRILEAYK